MLQLCSSRWLIPKILVWSLHHNVFVYATGQPQPAFMPTSYSNTAPNLPKNILQSTDEESINIILVCYERCLLSLQEWSGCFIPIVALIGGFLMKPFFWANCIQLGKISAHPIIGQSIQHLRVQYISKNSDAQRQWMACRLCFFRYISQTSNKKHVKNGVTNPGKQSNLNKEIPEISCCIRRAETFLYYGKLLYRTCHLQPVSQVENDLDDGMWIFLVEQKLKYSSKYAEFLNKHVAVGEPSGLQRYPNTGEQ